MDSAAPNIIFIATACIVLLAMAASVLMTIASWKVHVKAGHPGWTSLMPFYNLYILTQIVGRPPWFMALFFIPFANMIAAVLVGIDLAKSFDKGMGFAALLILLPMVGIPMLGFGNAQYIGSAAAS